MNCPLYHYIMSSLSLVSFLTWSIFFLEMSMATPTFFCVPFAWSIIFHPFTFSLFFSLEWRWVFSRQHIIGSFFFFFNQPSYSLSFGWLIIDTWELGSAIFPFSHSSISPLFLLHCVSVIKTISLMFFTRLISISSSLCFVTLL